MTDEQAHTDWLMAQATVHGKVLVDPDTEQPLNLDGLMISTEQAKADLALAYDRCLIADAEAGVRVQLHSLDAAAVRLGLSLEQRKQLIRDNALIWDEHDPGYSKGNAMYRRMAGHQDEYEAWLD